MGVYLSRPFEEIAGVLDAIVNTYFPSFVFQIMDSEAGFVCLFLDSSADGLLFLLTARLTCDVFHRSG